MAPHDAYGPPPRRRPADAALSRRSFLRLRRTAAARSDVPYERVAAQVREDRERGDPTPWLRAVEPVAEVIAELAAVAHGQPALDAGAGDGNVAARLARAGADVDACDPAVSMVARGRARCGASVRWRRADLDALPYPDASFDRVVSAFGAVLAPRARRVAAELVRVCRPGGRVLVAAWVPRGLPGDLPRLVEEVRPLPDGVPSPARWGIAAVAERRFAGRLVDLELRTRSVALAFPSPDALFAALTPATLDPAAREVLRPRFDALLASHNNRPPAAEVDGRYLLVTGRRPG